MDKKSDIFILKNSFKAKTSELEKTQKEFLEAKRLSDLGALAATVAHELRNPLGVIRMAVFNIKKKVKDSSLDSHLASIEKKIKECDRIIKNMLNYSKISIPKYEKLVYGEIINECVEKAKNKYINWNVKINFTGNYNKDNFFIGDRIQFAELCFNIIDNAFLAFPDKCGIIEIKADINKEKNKFILIVADNGIGIDEEDIPRLMEPFFTRRAKGIGLGLTVCKQIVDLHNGTIEIKSKKNEGTQVIVTLPIKQ